MTDYPMVPLGDLAANERGAIAIGPFGSRMKADAYVDYGFPVIRGTNISTRERELKGDWVYVTEDFAAGLPNCIAYPGDLVFPHRGAVGELALITPKTGNVLLSTSMMKFTPNPQVVDSAFLYYYFRSPGGKSEILRFSSQVGTPGIGQPLTSMRQFQVPLPPLKEQRRIAEVLAALDDKIQANQEVNRTLQSLAHATFLSWFIDLEPLAAKTVGALAFPSMPPDVFDALDHGGLSADFSTSWPLVSLLELVRLIGGGTPKRKSAEYWDGEIPWFSVRDAPTSHEIWVLDTEERITEAGLNNSSTNLLRQGTTIISARGTVGRLALVGTPMAMNQSCYGVQGADGIGDFFVYFSLLHAVSELQQKTHGSVFDTITRSTFESLKQARPPTVMLDAFEDVVGPYMGSIKDNCFENKSLQDLRDQLVPEYMRGAVNLNVSIGE